MRFVRISAIALFLAVSGCGGDSTGPSTPSVSGVWNLRIFNGTPLPSSLTSAGVKITYLAAVLTMTGNSSGTFTETYTYTLFDAPGSTIQTDTGTWTSNGTSVTLVDDTAHLTSQATVSGTTMTEAKNGSTSVYGR